MPNAALTRQTELTAFRKLSQGIWRSANDPTIYGWFDLQMDAALDYAARFEQQYAKKLTVTHMVTKVVADILARYPEVNAVLRLNRIYLRDQVDICLNVAAPDQGTRLTDIVTAKVPKADQKSLLEIIDEVDAQAGQLRAGRGGLQTGRGPKALRRVPGFLMRPLMTTLSFLHLGLNLDTRWLGIPADPFGSALITNLGSLGLPRANILAPLVPFTRMPLVVTIGSIHDAPIVDDGALRVGKLMNVSFSADHRVTDGPAGVGVVNRFIEVMEHPFDHFDPV